MSAVSVVELILNSSACIGKQNRIIVFFVFTIPAISTTYLNRKLLYNGEKSGLQLNIMIDTSEIEIPRFWVEY
jgi:hypothetical protein